MSSWKRITVLFKAPNQAQELKVFEGLTEDARSEEKGGKGGFSISVNTGQSPQSGFMISDTGSEKRHPFSQDEPHLSVPDLRAFVRTNSGLLKPAFKFFGGWLDDEGKLCLDVSSNIHCEHGSDELCPHRWDAYLKMIINRQQSIYHIQGRKERKYLDAQTGKEDFPEYAHLFEEHERNMAKYLREAEARTAAVIKSAGNKVFFRIGPDATDEQLVEILNQIAGK